MKIVFQTSTKNFDLIQIEETSENYYITYFNSEIVSEDMTFAQALKTAEEQMSL